jgi:hypothetical protein
VRPAATTEPSQEIHESIYLLIPISYRFSKPASRSLRRSQLAYLTVVLLTTSA